MKNRSTLLIVTILVILVGTLTGRTSYAQAPVVNRFSPYGNGAIVSGPNVIKGSINFQLTRQLIGSGFANVSWKGFVVLINGSKETVISNEIVIGNQDFNNGAFVDKVLEYTMPPNSQGSFVTLRYSYYDYNNSFWTQNQYISTRHEVKSEPYPGDWTRVPSKWFNNAISVDATNHKYETRFVVSATTPVLTRGQSLSSANGQYVLQLQDDGNLVLRKLPSWDATWSTKTSDSNLNYNYSLMFQPDGNLVLFKSPKSRDDYKAIWASGSDVPDTNAKHAYFLFQNDGNLCMYYPGLEGKAHGLSYRSGTENGRVSGHWGQLR